MSTSVRALLEAEMKSNGGKAICMGEYGKEEIGIILFADDLAIIAETEGLHKSLGVLRRFVIKEKLKVNVEKNGSYDLTKKRGNCE